MKAITVRIIMILLMAIVCQQACADLVIARAPQLSPSILAKIWKPYIDYLSEATGEKIFLKLYTERSKFESDLIQEKVDLYFGNPAYAVVGKLSVGYIPIVRGDKKRLKGIIVVRKDSPFKTVEDLKNQQIVFPSKTAFAASLYIRDQLENVIKIPFKEAFVDTHDNAYRSVLTGKYLAAGGVRRTLEREVSEIKDKLRIIYETPGVKPHVLVVHPRVSGKTRNTIINATLKLNESESGRELLKKLKMEKPIKADYEKDYKHLEALSKKVYGYLLDHNS